MPRATGIKFKYDASITGSELMARIEGLERNKKPKSSAPYIGLEFEFFSDYRRETLYAIAAKFNLQRICRFKHDGSIRPNRENQTALELGCLIPQKHWKRYLKAIVACLKKMKAEFNDSCGLHVHLDHRVSTGRNPASNYLSLQRMQNFLFSLAHPSRRNNRYCRFEPQTDFFDKFQGNDRYTAVNTVALKKYRTIELRLMHGTLDIDEIKTFINCLLFAIKRCDEAVTNFASDTSFEWTLNTLLNAKGMPESTKKELIKKFPPPAANIGSTSVGQP